MLLSKKGIFLLLLPVTISIFIYRYIITVNNASSFEFKSYNMTKGHLVKTPVYFLSHGGPTFLYKDAEFGGDRGAFEIIRQIGTHIRETIKPKYIIMVSAHWQSRANNEIEIAVPQEDNFAHRSPDVENQLIYDFYGFPKHMYKEEFHTKNDVKIANNIAEELNAFFAGTEGYSSLVCCSLTKRGIDHGVWVPLKVAFPIEPPNYWNLDIPMIQISLTADDTDFDTHYKLGQALSKYREEGGLILVSGMSVHNLRDISVHQVGPNKATLEYSKEFNQAIRDILLDTEKRDKLEEFKNMLTDPAKRKLLNSAHPTLEHFVPLIVGLGAGEGTSDNADDDKYDVKELYNKEQMSLGWGIYQFGK